MINTVIKRDGKKVKFDKERIIEAITKSGVVQEAIKEAIADNIWNLEQSEITVEEIQDKVEEALMASNNPDVARSYVRFRYKRELIRNDELRNSVMGIISHKNSDINEENSNKNPVIVSTQRDYMAGEISKDITDKLLLTEDILEADKLGILHVHDKDYFVQHTFNCCLVNLEDMLQNGTVISGTKIEKPHSFYTACNISTQAMAQIASNQYGGQTESIAHLAPFVEISRQKIRKEVMQEVKEAINLGELSLDIGSDKYTNYIDRVTEKRLREEIKSGVQTIQYQILTLMTTNGQTPFVTIFLALDEVPEGKERDDLAMIIEEVLKQRIQGIKNEAGEWITPAFPKLVYLLEEDNITPDSKYWYLTELAAKCTAKRMVPDYVSKKKMFEYKVDKQGRGHFYPPMGCRSFLTPYIATATVGPNEQTSDLWMKYIQEGQIIDNDNRVYPTEDIFMKATIINKTEKDCKVDYLEMTLDGIVAHVSTPLYYSRFNQGVCTINLVDVALSARKEAESGKDLYKRFWKIFDDRLELCHKALKIRHRRLVGVSSDVSPIHWQFGALARLEKHEKIDKLLYNGYSTISLGYAGLYECVYAMTEKSHTDEEAKPFALEIMEYMNKKCQDWKEDEHIDYSIYGTPLESTTYKFATKLKERFGVIENVTDHDYITNSYHVNVREKIDPFTKLKFESEFQRLSPGGAISYIETANLEDNIEAVLEVIKYIYDNIIYAELNTKSDFCQACGYNGEIRIVEDLNTHNLSWRCPNCGNTDQTKMNVARRTCGYIGTNFWNQGRTQEIRDRVVHLGGDLDIYRSEDIK